MVFKVTIIKYNYVGNDLLELQWTYWVFRVLGNCNNWISRTNTVQNASALCIYIRRQDIHVWAPSGQALTVSEYTHACRPMIYSYHVDCSAYARIWQLGVTL